MPNPDVIDLAAMETALPRAKFPNGAEHQIVALDLAGWQLYGRLEQGEATDADLVTLLRRCVPSATPEEIDSLTPQMGVGVVGIAKGKVQEVLALLGNAGGAAPQAGPAPTTPRSTPRTPRATSRRASPAPTASPS